VDVSHAFYHLSVVRRRLSDVVIGCLLRLSVVVVCCWLSVVECTIDCRVSLSVVVFVSLFVGCRMSVVGGSVVECCYWLSFAFVGGSSLLLVVGCRLPRAQQIVGCFCW
jgi:hypothetical protein